MARYPSFYALGAVAGLSLWLTNAPTPFPLLGFIAMVSGGLGAVFSILYVANYEPWQWRVKLAALRRTVRAVERAFAALAGELRSRPLGASELRALRARS